MPALNDLAAAPFDADSTYADKVHFVHLYVVEPHPLAPDPSPYTGDVWEESYSTKSQPKTYPGRVANARDIVPLLQAGQLLLIDDLVPGELNNPLWCTYGTCPNCAYLIRQDGVVHDVQTWVSASDTQSAIDALLR